MCFSRQPGPVFSLSYHFGAITMNFVELAQAEHVCTLVYTVNLKCVVKRLAVTFFKHATWTVKPLNIEVCHI